MLEFRREEFVVGDIVHSLVPEEAKKRNLSLFFMSTRDARSSRSEIGTKCKVGGVTKRLYDTILDIIFAERMDGWKIEDL